MRVSPHPVPRRAVAVPRLAVAGAPVEAEAGLLAARPKVPLGAGLVAQEPRPAGPAGALPLHRVTAGDREQEGAGGREPVSEGL